MRTGKFVTNENAFMTADAADGVNEVMTAVTSFLLRMTDAFSPSSSGGNRNNNRSAVQRLFNTPEQQLRALSEIFKMLSQVKRDIDVTCANVKIISASPSSSSSSSSSSSTNLVPSVECWESML